MVSYVTGGAEDGEVRSVRHGCNGRGFRRCGLEADFARGTGDYGMFPHDPSKLHLANTAQGVCLGSGIGNFDEVYDTVVAYEKNVRWDNT